MRAIDQGMLRVIRPALNGIAQPVIFIVTGVTRALGAIFLALAFIVRPVIKGIGWVIRPIRHAIEANLIPTLNSFRQFIRRVILFPANLLLRLRSATVTLSMEDDAIRVVVFRGRRVVAWDFANLKPESTGSEEQTGTSDNGAGRLRELLTGLNIHRGRIVTDLPLFTPLLRHFQLPQANANFVNAMVESEVLDTIPFSADEVDITSHQQRVGGSVEVVAVAVPRRAIDGQVRLVRAAGLTPKAAYSQASALALAAGVPDAIVIHLQPSETAVVLVRGGSPRVVHQLELPKATGTAQEQADALALAVEQVGGYYQSLDPEVDSAAFPVVMTGLAMENGSFIQVLAQTLGRTVLDLAPPLRVPDGFPSAAFAANLGLLLAHKAKGNPWGKGSMRKGATPNLLPERHLPQGLLPVQGLAVIVILVLLASPLQYATRQIDSLVQDTDNLTEEVKELRTAVQARRTDVGLENDAKKELEMVTNQIESLESQVTDLDDDMTQLLARLDAITTSARPENVRLSSLSPGMSGFVLVGNTDSHNDVLEYAANLRSSEHFSDATIIEVTGSSQGSTGGNLTFRILATIEKEAAEIEVPATGEAETKP